MKIVSWNLNGLQATLQSGAFRHIAARCPDILCLQEIRTKQEPIVLNGYEHIWNHCQKDGYAGTAILCRQPPCHIWRGFEDGKTDPEGRLLTIELTSCFVINAYVPNSQKNLKRHMYRMEWDERFREFVCNLRDEKPVIIAGDFNVARANIDIYPENIRQYWAGQGYASDERSNFETLIECGFTDAFRRLHPTERSYTWWSNRLNKRQQDRGWRLDYFLVDDDLRHEVKAVRHLKEIYGSDHCPIELEIRL
nr:exodeoxyribonuclease III [uncultured Oscillibacter sp.]